MSENKENKGHDIKVYLAMSLAVVGIIISGVVGYLVVGFGEAIDELTGVASENDDTLESFEERIAGLEGNYTIIGGVHEQAVVSAGTPAAGTYSIDVGKKIIAIVANPISDANSRAVIAGDFTGRTEFVVNVYAAKGTNISGVEWIAVVED